MLPRILWFHLRLMWFDYQISPIPGKHLYMTDTLSRFPVHQIPDAAVLTQQKEVEHFIQTVVTQLPDSKDRLERCCHAQLTDRICTAVRNYRISGWPRRQTLTKNLLPHWQVHGELSLYEDLLLYGTQIIVPIKLQNETLYKIYLGYQGIHKCHLSITSSVWWPGVSKAIENCIKNWSQCLKSCISPKELPLSSPLLSRPWQKIAADLFKLDKSHYLLIVDYFFRFPEVLKLTSTTLCSIVIALKSTITHHEMPSIAFTDNGPQFSSLDFKEFVSTYSFCHITISPSYPQSNGMMETTLGTVTACP